MNVWVTGLGGQLSTVLFKRVSHKKGGVYWHFTSKSEVDITDKNQVEYYINRYNIDVIINTAAYTNVDKAQQNPQQAFLINSEAVALLAQICKKYSVFLVHISTDFVFDGKAQYPYAETDLPSPVNVYGESKLFGERHIMQLMSDFLIFRTSWLYGEGHRHFVSKMIALSQQYSQVRVASDQMGSPTYVYDFADFLVSVINSKSFLKRRGVYHFSNLGVCSRYEWAVQIFQQKGIDIKIEPCLSEEFVTLAKRPHYSPLNTALLQADFNYTPAFWKEALQRYIHQLS